MPTVREYSKSSGFYRDAKKAFFQQNDALLEKSLSQNKLYVSQPHRVRCKICEADLGSDPDFSSHGISYVFCGDCGHLNGMHDDTKEFANQLYVAGAGEEYAKNYIDDDYENRTRNIYLPKLDFLIKNLPSNEFSVLDVGCGAGYFVMACRLRNIEARGLDVGESMVNFGNRQIGHLTGEDDAPLKSVSEQSLIEALGSTDMEVVSAIGVIEHLHDPRSFFDAFKSCGAKYLFYSVPMFSLSVALENVFKEVFPRQLSGAHTHLFSESSIVRMNELLGTQAVAEWRFGTDITDLLRATTTMLAKNGGSEKLIDYVSTGLGENVDGLQAVLDEAHFCSEIHCVVSK